MTPELSTIAVAADRGVATVTLGRPEVLNACDPVMIAEMRSELAGLEADPSVRAVMITGAGRAFCAGADLAAPRQVPQHYTDGQWVAATLGDGWNRLIRELRSFPKPTIAAVNGVAAGGGVALALACDIVVADRSAYFRQVFVPQLAIVPDAGNTWLVTQLIGVGRAKALMLLGDDLDAGTARDWGLIWDVADDGEATSRGAELALRLAANSMPATAALKHVLDRSIGSSLDAALDLELETNKRLAGRAGFREGRSSFVEKRRPDFRGNE